LFYSKKYPVNMTDVLIVQQFEILIINIFGMHIGFIILQVLTIMEVPLAGSQIGPCLKCSELTVPATDHPTHDGLTTTQTNNQRIHRDGAASYACGAPSVLQVI
jgi:hypothetical protein